MRAVKNAMILILQFIKRCCIPKLDIFLSSGLCLEFLHNEKSVENVFCEKCWIDTYPVPSLSLLIGKIYAQYKIHQTGVNETE